MSGKAINIIVTGGSGLLGRAVVAHLKEQGHTVKGLALSRAGQDLDKLDLRDQAAVKQLVQDFKPQLLVHCAAERRPDVAEKDPEGARQLNVDVSRHLAELSRQHQFRMIYISTDYVFDGHAPECGYEVDTKPNYGQVKNNDESAINILIDSVKKAAQGEKVAMDDWAIRYPTLVDDVAKVIGQLATLQNPYPPILHFSSQEKYTKYTIAIFFASLLQISGDPFVRVTEGPKTGETIRPRDCHLSTRALNKLGIDTSTVVFEDWWRAESKTSWN